MSDHAHPHSHDHGPGHSHDHDEGDTYFIDQLCMVGLSGAFGMVCLCLWFWQTEMLRNLLAEQFHIYVLLSGIGLVVIALSRAGILWFQSRDPEFLHSLRHEHGHEHSHDYGHAHEHAIQEKPPHLESIQAASKTVGLAVHGHQHAPGETCTHDHEHEHAAAMPVHEHHHGHGHADHDEADHDHGWAPWRYVVILVPLILFLLGLPNRPPSINDLSYERLIGDFASIIYEALPFIVLGVLIAGLLEEFVPQQAIAKLVPRNRLLAVGIGALLGLVFPMCECGIIVVMKRLLRKGLPLSVCIAYMLAGPVINLIVMTSTFVAFSGYNQPGRNDVLGGPWLVVAWRVGLSYIVAIITALVVDWQWQRHGKRLLHPSVLRGLKNAADDDNGAGQRTWGERLGNITQTGLHDFVDIMAFLVLGAVLAAGGKFIIKESNVQAFLQDTPAVAILLMMGIAVLFCLCSEADAFVAANFPLFWPDGSKLAFLVLGPMLDLKLFLMYTRVFKARLIYTIIAALVVQVFVYTSIVDYFFGREHPREQKELYLSPNDKAILSSIALGPDLYSQMVHLVPVCYPPPTEKGEAIDFKNIDEMERYPDLRSYYKNRVVELRGQYSPGQGDNVFRLARFKIQCCYSDLVEVSVPVISRESITGYKKGDWIKVTGKVEFREMGNSYHAILVVSKATDVVKCDPDPNPYVK